MVISAKKSIAVVSALILTASVCTGVNVFDNSSDAVGCASVTASAAEAMRDITSQELVEDMGLGWNLGNNFDSYGTWVSGMDTEGCWGNPKATKELIQKVKASGFKSVRIPVTWAGHFESDGVTINEEWMARVQEVVDWCVDEGLYVILNIHHDGNGDEAIDWVRDVSTDYDTTIAKYTGVWEQISNRFKDYSDYLVFESMNEVEFKDLSKNDAYALMTKVNQAFVDTVRATGGNNAERHLLIAGYITDIAQTCDSRYQMPTDPANRCMVSVHYYTPSPFCVAGVDTDWCTPLTTWGTDADYEELDTNFKKMYEHFVSQGTPVIIGEYGVLSEAKNQKDPESIKKYLKAVSETAVKYGMCPVLWDSGVGGDMPYIDRNSVSFISSDIEAMYKDVAERIESGELSKDENIKLDSDLYEEVEVTLTDGCSVDISGYDKLPVGAKIQLSCSTDWDNYGGGAVHYDNGNSADWVYDEYGWNSVYDIIEMKFSDTMMSSMKKTQLDFFIWWTALDVEGDDNSGHASELSFKDNKVILLFEKDNVPEDTTTTEATTTTESTTTTVEDTTTVSETTVTTTVSETETSEISVTETTVTETNTSETSDSSADTSPVPDVEASLLGDVNSDGEVDIRDVTYLNQALIKAITLTDVQSANANVIDDGVVDISDLGQLKKFIIKLISEF